MRPEPCWHIDCSALDPPPWDSFPPVSCSFPNPRLAAEFGKLIHKSKSRESRLYIICAHKYETIHTEMINMDYAGKKEGLESDAKCIVMCTVPIMKTRKCKSQHRNHKNI